MTQRVPKSRLLTAEGGARFGKRQPRGQSSMLQTTTKHQSPPTGHLSNRSSINTGRDNFREYRLSSRRNMAGSYKGVKKREKYEDRVLPITRR
jgi:hypothetical protein